MSVRFPLSVSTWNNAEVSAIQRVLQSGQYTMGPEVSLFEKEFSAYFGSRYAVMVNSGSSANLLMIAALRYVKDLSYRLSPGDEVIVPAIAWATSFYPLYQYGLRLRFVDIDVDTLSYDISMLKAAITSRTKCILAVNLLGNAQNYGEMLSLAVENGIFLLEDNCQSMGASYNGKCAGTFGVMGTFSTFYSHHISTMEGGVVVTDNEELFHILLSLRAHGWTRNLPHENKVTGFKSEDEFVESFKFVLPGYNVRPTEISGAIGVEQLKKLPYLVRRRRENAVRFNQAFSDHPAFRIQKELGESSWFGFAIIARRNEKWSRNEILRKFKDTGFECRPISTGNFTKNPVLKLMDCDVSGGIKNAEFIDACGFFIGNNHVDNSDAVDAISSIAF
ncbi:DegT/DnrJ/EryC1/StrS family aminotransferase [Azorhizobium doebereinerae]|uniref:DegT/DnrJ/EryC1/StrS family aminotransferase n=1 Tax=Azorhizobium doebereinerae TaxID=281091 RepID=UPI0009FC8DCF|nr:DegT/DnrJ/EryC1/StrS family aminotransferase [Azorhizobium doebereinerae]